MPRGALCSLMPFGLVTGGLLVRAVLVRVAPSCTVWSEIGQKSGPSDQGVENCWLAGRPYPGRGGEMLSKAHREAGNLLALEHRTAGGGASRVAEGWSRIR